MARPTKNPADVLQPQVLALNESELAAITRYAFARGIYTKGNSKAARELIQLGIFFADSLMMADKNYKSLIDNILQASDAGQTSVINEQTTHDAEPPIPVIAVHPQARGKPRPT